VRSLIIVQAQPYPPIGGVALRNWQNINLLAQLGVVKVISIYANRQAVATLPGNNIDWCHYDLYQMPRSRLSKIQHRLQWIRPLGVPRVDWVYKEEIAQELAQCLHSFQPDLVVFEEIWLYRYLATVQRYGCGTVLDNHNLEVDKERYRHQADGPWYKGLMEKWRLRQVRAVERAFIRGVTQTWLCSNEDQVLLQQCYGDYPTWVIPNGVDVAFYDSVRQGQMPLPDGWTTDGPTVLFLAKFSYGPNQEAVEILMEDIYPRLAEHYPACRVLLVGTDPTPAMERAALENSHIVVTGRVPDVRPYLAAAQVIVVPLRQGGGTRLKILEAFAAGCPVVSTAKGAEGLQVQDGQHLLLRESAADLAAGIMSLWEDEAQRQHLAAAAWNLVNCDYSRDGVGQRLEQAMLRLERA
jgi:glycosyltransferase involved in cell wall biosynthesis